MDWLVGHLMTRQPPDRTGLKDKKNYISLFCFVLCIQLFFLVIDVEWKSPINQKKKVNKLRNGEYAGESATLEQWNVVEKWNIQ